MDEPTNHLDMQSREVLFDALSRYRRTVVFAAHDRYMLDRLADKTVRVEAGEVVLFPGNYAYATSRAKQEVRTAKRERPAPEPAPARGPGPKKRKPAKDRFADADARLRDRLAAVRREYELARSGFNLARARELALEEKGIEEEMSRLKAEQLAASAETEGSA